MPDRRVEAIMRADIRFRLPGCFVAAPSRTLGLFGAQLRSLGPYMLVELLLPGGTLIALALYWLNRRRAASCSSRSSTCARVRAWLSPVGAPRPVAPTLARAPHCPVE
jgi:hypothetical protein